MIIEINNSRTIGDIQKEFSDKFPFLKIEFFNFPHNWEEPSNDTPCRPEQLLGEIRQQQANGIITLDPASETGAIEKEFERRFALNVQIYRRQMDQWIQTAGTDILTLSEQNQIARDSATFYNPNHQFHNKQ